MAEALGLNWDTAKLTTAAGNVKPHDRRRVISVPRETFGKVWPLAWSELEERAVAGDDGCELWLIAGMDIAPWGRAYMREGLTSDRSLTGRALLYSQGW